jgi:glycerol-3-phosphate dehydrogenase (NAD(P)+)
MHLEKTTMTSVPVGIVGAGPFGTALADVIATRGGSVVLHSEDADIVRDVNERHRNERRLPGVTLPSDVKATGELAELCKQTRFIVLAVSSARIARTVRELAPLVTENHIVVHAIGALANGEERVSEVLLRETRCKRVGALAGPALARDLAERRPCAIVVASSYEEVLKLARSALGAPPVLRVYGSADLLGVELAAALSGAMTVAVGISDGLGLGVGPRAVLITRAVAEAARVGAAAGARDMTFGGLAGLGNLLARGSSASSERSDDYLFGVSLARPSGSPRPPTEGSRTISAAGKMARALGVRIPSLDTLDAIVNEGVAPAAAAGRLLETPTDTE